MENKPKVTVCMTTYNLQAYVEEAVKSVLRQKTSFNYELVISDDCSTDNTVELLKKLKSLSPGVITLLESEKNLGSLANSNKIFSNLQSEYFIFLDGDDYWVDENMLQKMVDFLDDHPDFVMVGGNTSYLRNNAIHGKVVDSNRTNRSYSFNDYINGRMPFVHTSAILVRNVVFCNGLPEVYRASVGSFENCALRGEDFRRLLHLERGKMFVMKDTFSVYRIHDKGMWQGASNLKRSIETAISYNFYSKYFETGKSFFEKMRDKSYNHLMITLVSDYSFCKANTIPEKEFFLLNAYLKDMKQTKTVKYGPIRRKVLKTILALLTR